MSGTLWLNAGACFGARWTLTTPGSCADGIDLVQGDIGQEAIIDRGIVGDDLYAKPFKLLLHLCLRGFQAFNVALDVAGGRECAGSLLLGRVDSQRRLLQLNNQHHFPPCGLVVQRMGQIAIACNEFLCG